MKSYSTALGKAFLFGLTACLIQFTVTACQSSFNTAHISPLPMADRRFNDYARFVSALPQEEGSFLAKLTATSWYEKYRKSTGNKWTKLEEERLARMRSWAASELAALNRSNRDVLYAFSGPDFLHMFSLFPGAKRYVMIALEPTGSLPDLAATAEGEVAGHLHVLDKSLDDFYKRSYFVTGSLLHDLSNTYLDGVAPILCAFLARTGNLILDMKYVYLSEKGEPTTDAITSVQREQGLQVDFVNAGDVHERRTLFYFSSDLRNGALSRNKALRHYLGSLDQPITYIKSASYLMHSRVYAAIRGIILDKSSAYVGDDTGIPYMYFPKDKWSMHLYGKYVKPIDEFRGVEQEDLHLAYQSRVIKPLPFNLGYHWNSEEQNLMVTIRKGPSERISSVGD
jgi:hypothetical protein